MGFRFRKAFRVGKLTRVNLSKSGVGYSFGIPGTGLRWGHYPVHRKRKAKVRQGQVTSGLGSCLVVAIAAVVICLLVGFMTSRGVR